jgi:hypothetical protein
MLAAHLYADILSVLADPLGFMDPPPGVPVAVRMRRCVDLDPARACFLCSMCPAFLPSNTPSWPFPTAVCP